MASEFYCYIYYRADAPFYVGKGSKKRAQDFKHHNKWVKSIFNKDGKENIKIELIECKDEQEAFELEKRWIAVFRSDGYVLCNFTDGGEGTFGRIISKNERKIISKRMKNNKIWLGKTHSKETKQKMSIAAIGKIYSEETKQKIGRASKGRKHTEEAKKEMSLQRSGENHPLYGKHHSEKSKIKMSKSAIGRSMSEDTKNKLSKINKGKKH